MVEFRAPFLKVKTHKNQITSLQQVVDQIKIKSCHKSGKPAYNGYFLIRVTVNSQTYAIEGKLGSDRLIPQIAAVNPTTFSRPISLQDSYKLEDRALNQKYFQIIEVTLATSYDTRLPYFCNIYLESGEHLYGFAQQSSMTQMKCFVHHYQAKKLVGQGEVLLQVSIEPNPSHSFYSNLIRLGPRYTEVLDLEVTDVYSTEQVQLSLSQAIQSGQVLFVRFQYEDGHFSRFFELSSDESRRYKADVKTKDILRSDGDINKQLSVVYSVNNEDWFYTDQRLAIHYKPVLINSVFELTDQGFHVLKAHIKGLVPTQKLVAEIRGQAFAGQVHRDEVTFGPVNVGGESEQFTIETNQGHLRFQGEAPIPESLSLQETQQEHTEVVTEQVEPLWEAPEISILPWSQVIPDVVFNGSAVTIGRLTLPDAQYYSNLKASSIQLVLNESTIFEATINPATQNGWPVKVEFPAKLSIGTFSAGLHVNSKAISRGLIEVLSSSSSLIQPLKVHKNVIQLKRAIDQVYCLINGRFRVTASSGTCQVVRLHGCQLVQVAILLEWNNEQFQLETQSINVCKDLPKVVNYWPRVALVPDSFNYSVQLNQSADLSQFQCNLIYQTLNNEPSVNISLPLHQDNSTSFSCPIELKQNHLRIRLQVPGLFDDLSVPEMVYLSDLSFAVSPDPFFLPAQVQIQPQITGLSSHVKRLETTIKDGDLSIKQDVLNQYQILDIGTIPAMSNSSQVELQISLFFDDQVSSSVLQMPSRVIQVEQQFLPARHLISVEKTEQEPVVEVMEQAEQVTYNQASEEPDNQTMDKALYSWQILDLGNSNFQLNSELGFDSCQLSQESGDTFNYQCGTIPSPQTARLLAEAEKKDKDCEAVNPLSLEIELLHGRTGVSTSYAQRYDIWYSKRSFSTFTSTESLAITEVKPVQVAASENEPVQVTQIDQKGQSTLVRVTGSPTNVLIGDKAAELQFISERNGTVETNYWFQEAQGNLTIDAQIISLILPPAIPDSLPSEVLLDMDSIVAFFRRLDQTVAFPRSYSKTVLVEDLETGDGQSIYIPEQRSQFKYHNKTYIFSPESRQETQEPLTEIVPQFESVLSTQEQTEVVVANTEHQELTRREQEIDLIIQLHPTKVVLLRNMTADVPLMIENAPNNMSCYESTDMANLEPCQDNLSSYLDKVPSQVLTTESYFLYRDGNETVYLHFENLTYQINNSTQTQVDYVVEPDLQDQQEIELTNFEEISQSQEARLDLCVVQEELFCQMNVTLDQFYAQYPNQTIYALNDEQTLLNFLNPTTTEEELTYFSYIRPQIIEPTYNISLLRPDPVMQELLEVRLLNVSLVRISQARTYLVLEYSNQTTCFTMQLERPLSDCKVIENYLLYEVSGFIKPGITYYLESFNFSLSRTAQESLQFDIMPKYATSAQTEITLELRNQNLFRVLPVNTTIYERMASSFVHCRSGNEVVSTRFLNASFDQIRISCSFQRFYGQIEILDKDLNQIYADEVRMLQTLQIGQLPLIILNKYSGSQVVQLQVEQPGSLLDQDLEYFLKIGGIAYRVQTDQERPYFIVNSTRNTDVLGDLMFTGPNEIRTETAELRVFFNQSLINSTRLDSVKVYKNSLANITDLESQLLQDQLTIHGGYFFDSPKLVLRQVKNDNKVFKALPLWYNETTAVFKRPIGLEQGLYFVSVQQDTLDSYDIGFKKTVYALETSTMVINKDVLETRPSDFRITDNFKGTLNFTVSHSLENFVEVQQHINNLSLGCRIESCDGILQEWSENFMQCQLDLEECVVDNEAPEVEFFLVEGFIRQRIARFQMQLVKSPRAVVDKVAFFNSTGLYVELREVQNLPFNTSSACLISTSQVVQSTPTDGFCFFSEEQLVLLEAKEVELVLVNNLMESFDPQKLSLYDSVAVSKPVQLDLVTSTFHSQGTEAYFEPKAILSNQEKTVVVRTSFNQTVQRYDSYSSLSPLCFLIDSNPERRETEVSCAFISENMDELEVTIRANTLTVDDYKLRVILGSMVSEDLGSLKVVGVPRLNIVYPALLDVDSLSQNGTIIFLIGQNFEALKRLEGVIRCAFLVESNKDVVITSFARESFVLSDNLLACPVSSTQAATLRSRHPSGGAVKPRLVYQEAGGITTDLALSVSEGFQKSTKLQMVRSLLIRGANVTSFTHYRPDDTVERTINLQVDQINIQTASSQDMTVTCEFSTGADWTIRQASGSYNCPVPLDMDFGDSQSLSIRVRFTQEFGDSQSTLEDVLLNPVEYTFLSSVYSFPIRRLPSITDIYPRVVWNMIEHDHIRIYGQHLTAGLCKLESADQLIQTVRADFISANEILCSLKSFNPDLQRKVDLQLSFSNGVDEPYSDSTSFKVAPQLPRVLSLQRPNYLMSGVRSNFTLQGTNLDSFGYRTQLILDVGGQRNLVNCSSNTTELNCFNAQLPLCLSDCEATVSMQSIYGGDAILQAYKLPLSGKMEFEGILNGTEVDTAVQEVRLNVTRESGLNALITWDEENNCNIQECRAVCLYKTPGHNKTFKSKLVKEDQAYVCEQPVYSGSFECSVEMQHFELKLLLDNYLYMNHTQHILCLRDTVVDNQTEVELFYAYQDNLIQFRAETFNPSIAGVVARCEVQTETQYAQFELITSQVDSTIAACQIPWSFAKNLPPFETFDVRLVQGSRSYPNYQFKLLRKPRIHRVGPSRVLKKNESLEIYGMDFDQDVDYECLFGEFFKQAAFVDNETIDCGSLEEIEFGFNSSGYSCFTPGLRDHKGNVFQVEKGSLAESRARFCLIQDITSFFEAQESQPQWIPAKVEGLYVQLEDAQRQLEFQLVSNSPIFELFLIMESPLTTVKLQINQVSSQIGYTDAQSSPLEIPCTIDNKQKLLCGPWPYLTDAAFNEHGTLVSNLTVVFETSLNQYGRLTYPISQTVIFFHNPVVDSHSPKGELVEFIDSQVTISGQFFTDEQCVWQEMRADQNVTVMTSHSIFYNSTTLACSLSHQVFERVKDNLILHLTRDNGTTLESRTDQEMIFKPWLSPHISKMEAVNSLGLMEDLSKHIGRHQDLLLTLRGANLLVAQSRNAECHFEAGFGRYFKTQATINDDYSLNCMAPHIPSSKQVGEQVLRRYLKVSLWISDYQYRVHFVSRNLMDPAPVGTDEILLLKFPEITKLQIVVEDQREEMTDLLTLDRYVLSQMTGKNVTFTLSLEDVSLFDQRGHQFKMVVISHYQEQAEQLQVLDPFRATLLDGSQVVNATIDAQALASQLSQNGYFWVGLVPQVEFEYAQQQLLSIQDLVNYNSPTFRVVDTSGLQVETLGETVASIPFAPGLTNTLIVGVRGTELQLGLEIQDVLQLLKLVLVSSDQDSSNSHWTYLSDSSLVLEQLQTDTLQNKDLLKFKFTFQGIEHAGQYCLKLSINKAFAYDCVSPTLAVFELPESIYSAVDRPCDVAHPLADYQHYFNRQSIPQLAILNNRVQLEAEEEALLCRFDWRVYEFLEHLFILKLGDMPEQWTLQDVLLQGQFGVQNWTDLALSGQVKLDKDGDVYFKSHIEAIYDPFSPQNLTRDTSKPEVGVYHPGEILTLQGFFLNNSANGVKLKLSRVIDDSFVVSGALCVPSSQYESKCTVPDNSFGEHLVSLVDAVSGEELMDEHSLNFILVLPVPQISVVSPKLVAVPSESELGQAEQRTVEIRLTLNWSEDESEKLKQEYKAATVCRLGTLDSSNQLVANMTWTGDNQLSCFFQNQLHTVNVTQRCIELSINGGRTFTQSNCELDSSLRIDGARAPIVYDFLPKRSLIADPTTITVSGVGFDSRLRYWCHFERTLMNVETTKASFVDNSTITCEKPLIKETEESHYLQISIYVSASDELNQQLAPILAKRFNQSHENHAYTRLVQVTPNRGDVNGGTHIVVQVDPLTISTERDLKCRFSSQSLPHDSGSVVYETVTAQLVDDQHISCVTPDWSEHFQADLPDSASVQEVFMQISEFDGTFREANELRYRFYKRPQIQKLSPPNGFGAMPTQIQLVGTGFVNYENLQVRAIDATGQLKPALQQTWVADQLLFLNTETVLVELPAATDSRRSWSDLIYFEVSLNGGFDWTTDGLNGTVQNYQILQQPQISSINKRWSVLSGGLVIEIEIVHLRYDPLCMVPAQDCPEETNKLSHCRFGDRETVLSHLNETHASCYVPAQVEEMTIPVELRTNGGLYFGTNETESRLMMVYSDAVYIGSLDPPEGHYQGGQIVNLVGRFDRILDHDLQVRFGGGEVTSIESINGTHLAVKLPGTTLPQDEETQIQQVVIDSLDYGLSFQNLSVEYTYKNYSIVNHIWPNVGPGTGGTLIHIDGQDLDLESTCQFKSQYETIMIKPVLINRELMLCEVSIHEPETFSFELNFAGGAYITSSGLTFTYYKDSHILSIYPEHVTLRANALGLNVTANGLNFQPHDNVTIRLDLYTAQGTVLDDRTLQFVPPVVPQTGPYRVELAINGMDFTMANENVTLTYHGDFAVNKISMTRIQQSVEDQNLSIIVYGVNLPRASYTGLTFYCIYEPSADSTVSFARVVTNATLTSEDGTHIQCDNVPTYFTDLGLTAEAFNASLYFSYDEQELQWEQRLTYYPAVNVIQVYPRYLAVTQSELVITLYGQKMVDAGEELSCKLTRQPDHLFNQTIEFFAQTVLFYSESQVQCNFKVVKKGMYEIAVAINGAQYVAAADLVTIIPALQIRDVEPAFILARQPGQMISVQVQNLVDDVWCTFEHTRQFLQPIVIRNELADVRDGHSTKAMRVSPSVIFCTVPDDLSGAGVGWIKLRLTANGNIRVRSQAYYLMRMTDRCPAGYQCMNGEVTACTPGFYCPGDNLNQPAKRCPIGYFQDESAASFCKPCKQGFMCPMTGMPHPLPCPPGFICDELKLNSPSQQCPSGFYCLAGSVGPMPFQNGLLNHSSSFLCTTGAYCKAGTTTGVVLMHSNSSAPAPCDFGMVCSTGSAEIGGDGPCPSGTFCPTPRHSGITCPPRHYCPKRGNSMPIKCPKGTYNMYSGQINCTACPIGHICPVQGLFLPLKCPPGYACNEENLQFPINLCKIGHICLGGVMSGTTTTDRSCYILRRIGNIEQCDNGITYKIDKLKEFSAQAMPSYFFSIDQYGFGNTDVCCWSHERVADWVLAIGKSVSHVDIFKSYYTSVMLETQVVELITGPYTKPVWDGMRIVDKSTMKQGLNPTDRLNTPWRKHKEVIELYARMMFTSHQAQLCPGGLLCLEGVYTDEQPAFANQTLTSKPQFCPSGSYCLQASDQVIGTNLCPPGYYCPPKTTYPKQTDPGHFSSNFGSVDQRKCEQGKFQIDIQTEACKMCPSGYMCEKVGTSTPIICPVGRFRDVMQPSPVCTLCPKGTFAFERGTKDPLECQECPPGRICQIEGSTNVSYSDPCPDGKVCRPGTGAKTALKCPEGYYCPLMTTVESQFDYRCEAGFFCTEETGFEQRTRNSCPQTYYCPPGTGEVLTPDDITSYETWQNDAPSRCPQGTGYDSQEGKKSIAQCFRNAEYVLLLAGLDLRKVGQADDDSGGGRLLQASSGKSLREKHAGRSLQQGPGRMLQQQASKSDPRLQDLFEIEFELGEVQDGNQGQPIRQFINTERHYIARWSPLNLDLVNEFIEIEAVDTEELETTMPNALFDMPASSYALVVVDLRHLQPETPEWTYGDDWAISFSLSNEQKIGDLSKPAPMPEQFLSKRVSKSQIMEFSIFAWKHLKLRIDILCYNSLYTNFRHLFINSTSVEIRRPFRAIYGTDMVFATSILTEYSIALPFNQPKLLPDVSDPMTAMPNQMISFAQNSPGDWVPPVRHRSTKNRNIWMPASLYWGARQRINLPYLPYFSNCKGYGNVIPFWALMEQHHDCELIAKEETYYMGPYSFGEKPIADTCEEIGIQCVYDEIFDSNNPMDRWFEVEAETALFDVSVDPVNYYDLMAKDFEPTEVLAVAPEEAVEEEGTVPKSIELILSYYQIDESDKKLIATEMVYDSLEPLTEAESLAEVQVDYELTFSFVPFSHKDLTIMFAFEWDFYLVLYCLVGLMSIIIMVFFVFYHRAVAQKPKGGPITNFKFRSYFCLTIPPAATGIGMALLPALMANLFIVTMMCGNFLQFKTHIFEMCDSPDGEPGCPLTFLDVVSPDLNAWAINYKDLRTGRCGVALIITGYYLMQCAMDILIPDKSSLIKVPTAYDGNIWEYYTWKRSNMVFVSIFLTFLMLVVIQFSFSDIFSAEIWFSIGGLKVMQIFIEEILMGMMDESMLVAPINTCLGVIVGLVTFGADDFLDFLQAFFVEHGILIFERLYQAMILEKVMEAVEGISSFDLQGKINNLFFAEDDGLPEEAPPVVVKKEDEAPADGEQPKKDEFEELQKESSSSDEEIFFSEEGSDAEDAVDAADEDPDVLLNNPNDYDNYADREEAEMSGHLQKIQDEEADVVDLERRKREKGLEKEESEDMVDGKGEEDSEEEQEEEEEDKKKQQIGDSEEEDADEEEDAGEDELDVDLDEDAIEYEVEATIGEYFGYSNDTLSCFYSVVFVALLWMFYEETVVAAMYGILIQDFVYYFLWQFAITPFQIVVDILFLNIIEWFLQYPMHDYLDYLALRFNKRRAAWKGNEKYINTQLEESIRSLDQLCFSSQHFFVQTLYVAGLTQVVLGVQTLLYCETYNFASDLGLFATIAVSYALAIAIHRMAISGGHFFKIWYIDDSVEKMEGQGADANIDEMFEDFEGVKEEQMSKQDTDDMKANLKDEDEKMVRFAPHQWRLIEKARVDEDRIKNELATDRVAAETFRDIFLTYNRPWLTGQLHEIFSPRTLFINRQQIIDQFCKILGEVSAEHDISVDGETAKKKEEETATHPVETLSPEEVERNKALSKVEKPRAETISLAAAAVGKYWLTRMRFIRALRVQVQSYLEQRVEERCKYCQTDFNLNVEVIQNIEDMFRAFLEESGEPMPGYSYQAWSRYFKKHVKTRTLCFDCSAMIEEYHMMKQQLIRLKAAPHMLNPLNPEYLKYREMRLRQLQKSKLGGSFKLKERVDLQRSFNRMNREQKEKDKLNEIVQQKSHAALKEEIRNKFAPGTVLRQIVDKWVGMVKQ